MAQASIPEQWLATAGGEGTLKLGLARGPAPLDKKIEVWYIVLVMYWYVTAAGSAHAKRQVPEAESKVLRTLANGAWRRKSEDRRVKSGKKDVISRNKATPHVDKKGLTRFEGMRFWPVLRHLGLFFPLFGQKTAPNGLNQADAAATAHTLSRTA